MTIYYSPLNSGFYDTKVGYSSYPPDIIDVTDRYYELLDQISNHGKRIVVSNGEVLLADRIAAPITWEEIKKKRIDLLKLSDWTQLADAPISNREEWVTYRQALRDIPQNFVNPEDVVFPEAP